jgi:hypothetical protein
MYLFIIGALLFFYWGAKSEKKLDNNQIFEQTLAISGSIQKYYANSKDFVYDYAPIWYSNIMLNTNQAFEYVSKFLNHVSAFYIAEFWFNVYNFCLVEE